MIERKPAAVGALVAVVWLLVRSLLLLPEIAAQQFVVGSGNAWITGGAALAGVAITALAAYFLMTLIPKSASESRWAFAAVCLVEALALTVPLVSLLISPASDPGLANELTGGVVMLDAAPTRGSTPPLNPIDAVATAVLIIAAWLGSRKAQSIRLRT